MKIKMNQAIADLTGKPIKDGEKNLSLGTICANALMLGHAEEKGVTAKEKLHRYDLGLKVYKDEEIDLTDNDIAMLNKVIALAYSPLIYGRVVEMLGSRPPVDPPN